MMTGMRWAAAMVAVLVVAGCGSAGDAPAAAPTEPVEPEMFDVHGTLMLTGEGSYKRGASCSGDDGYDDIASGAQVTVRNGDGTKVALGEIGSSRSVGSWAGDCKLWFTVLDVPSGGGIYSVEVTHRGEINFTEDDALHVELTLG